MNAEELSLDELQRLTVSLPSTAGHTMSVAWPYANVDPKQGELDNDSPASSSTSQDAETVDKSSHPFITALKRPSSPWQHDTGALAIANLSLTDNSAVAHLSTLSPLVDLFHSLSSPITTSSSYDEFEAAWQADPLGTVRIIVHARSIPQGKGDRVASYHGLLWLWEKSPRTLLGLLEELVEPRARKPVKGENKSKLASEEDGKNVVTTATTEDNGFEIVSPEDNLVGDGEEKEDEEKPLDPANARSHGYYEDLSNLLLLVTNFSRRSEYSGPVEFISSVIKSDHRLDKATRAEARRKRGHKSLAKWKADIALKEKNPELFETTKSERVAADKQRGKVEMDQATIARRSRRADRARTVQDLLKTNDSYRALHIRIARLFADRIAADRVVLDASASSRSRPVISTAAKWAPSQGKSIDLQTLLFHSIAVLLSPSLPLSRAASTLQKDYLAPLRAANDIVERHLASNPPDFSSIKYQGVPSHAMRRNKALFIRKDPAGFREFLSNVMAGKLAISGATLTPATLVAEARRVNEHGMLAEVLDAQWQTLSKSIAESGDLGEALAVADVSGSMNFPLFKDHSSPMDSSIGLSLLLSQIAPPPFNSTFLTFSSEPQLVELDSTDGFVANVHKMGRANWGQSTNILATFRLILQRSVEAKLEPSFMIKRLFIFSDMQFDMADDSYESSPSSDLEKKTPFEIAKREFEEQGYQLPELVFWNLAGRSDTKPATAKTPGVALVSGYSAALLKVFLEGGDYPDQEEGFSEVIDGVKGVVVEHEKEIDPVSVMNKALGHASFAGIKVVD